MNVLRWDRLFAHVQVVILAGGLGTRLRPLTHARPKVLLPLLNRPMILHMVERLPATVDEVLLAASYKTEQLRAFFRSHDVGRRVEVVRERKALGTGGALKNLEDQLGDTFLAFNGDIVSSLPVPDLVAAHGQRGGVGTIALWEVDDPSGFGVVRMKGNRITKFVEKPTPEKAPSRLVNAGAYAFEREILELIDPGRPVSLEREVFPRAIRRGLYGFRFEGFWSDVGTRENFLRATEMLLREQGSEVSLGATIRPTATIRKPVAVGAGTTVAGKVGPVASVGRDCSIGEARLRDCVVFDRVTIADGAEVTGSLVGDGCRIGPRAVVRESILGDGARIRADAAVIGRRVRR